MGNGQFGRAPTPRRAATQQESTIQFTVAGELDLSNAPKMSDEIARALDGASAQPRRVRLLLDLQELSFIDSAGMQSLVRAKRRCMRDGVRFGLRVGDTQVKRILSVAGVAGFLGLEPTLEP